MVVAVEEGIILAPQNGQNSPPCASGFEQNGQFWAGEAGASSKRSLTSWASTSCLGCSCGCGRSRPIFRPGDVGESPRSADRGRSFGFHLELCLCAFGWLPVCRARRTITQRRFRLHQAWASAPWWVVPGVWQRRLAGFFVFPREPTLTLN